jgi:hypothetical protein
LPSSASGGLAQIILCDAGGRKRHLSHPFSIRTKDDRQNKSPQNIPPPLTWIFLQELWVVTAVDIEFFCGDIGYALAPNEF